nr:hypothetical protein CFP56_03573 [Quercus suber]
MSEHIALPPSIEHVEALACRRATLFAKDFNLQAVIFKGDSKTIINYLKSDEDYLASFGHLIEDSRHLASSFQAVTFSHVKRNGNNVADKLAKLARQCHVPRMWVEDIHSDASNFVLMDRSFC